MIGLIIFVVLVVLVISNRIAGRTFVGKVLLGLDLFMNVVWDRDFGVTISSQCGKYWKTGNPPAFWHALHVVLNTIQKDHCEIAIASDLARAQAAIKLLTN